jgi:hypothetical protein
MRMPPTAHARFIEFSIKLVCVRMPLVPTRSRVACGPTTRQLEIKHTSIATREITRNYLQPPQELSSKRLQIELLQWMDLNLSKLRRKISESENICTCRGFIGTRDRLDIATLLQDDFLLA